MRLQTHSMRKFQDQDAQMNKVTIKCTFLNMEDTFDNVPQKIIEDLFSTGCHNYFLLD